MIIFFYIAHNKHDCIKQKLIDYTVLYKNVAQSERLLFYESSL